MSLQILSQPHLVQNSFSVNGVLSATTAVFNSISANYINVGNVSAPALSGKFYGDGSQLTGLSGVGGTYTPPANATFTSSVSAPALSGVHYGDGSKLTGIAGTYTPPANATFTSSVSAPALSGTFYGDGSNLINLDAGDFTQGTLNNARLSAIVSVQLAVIAPSFTGSHFGDLSGTHYGDGSNLSGVIKTQYTPPANATFTSSVSAPALSGTHYGDGSNLSGVIKTQYSPPANATFTSSVSAPALSGTFYGDGSKLVNILSTDSTKLPLAGGTLIGTLNGTIGSFSTSLSSPALSGTFYGDGSKLTGIAGTYTPPANATFTSSVSAPALSGTHYGDGSKLSFTNIQARDAFNPIGGITFSDGFVSLSASSTSQIITFDNAFIRPKVTIYGTVSALSLSGMHYGDGNNLSFSNIQARDILTGLPSGGITFGSNSITLSTTNTQVMGIDTTSLTKVTIYGSVSAPALSGTFYGDGSNLSGVIKTQYTPPANATFTSSVSAPALSGTHYGDGSNLSGVIKTQYTPPANATFTSSVSAPSLSGSVLYSSGDSYINSISIGRGAGNVNTNTVLGAGALASNTIGGSNVAIGYSALASSSTVGGNVAIGRFALTSNGLGSSNTAIGTNALSATGDSNLSVAVGSASLKNLTTGDSNIAIGYNAGNAITSGTNNTIIGSIAGTASLSNTVIIGAGSTERMRIDSNGNTTFTTSVSAPSLSGTHYGKIKARSSDGENVTLLGRSADNVSTITAYRNDETTGTGSVFFSPTLVSISTVAGQAMNINSSNNTTFTGSVSAPSLSGSHYGDGSNLLNLNSSNITTAVNGSKSGTYTLALADAGGILSFNSSVSSVCQVPANSVVPFAIGTQMVVIQEGTGTVTFQIVPSSGVDLKYYNNKYITSGQYSLATLVKVGTDSWRLGGTLS